LRLEREICGEEFDVVEPESIHSTRWTNVRRSQRVLLSVPVEVYLQAENASLSEEGHTLVVNAHGGLVKLAMKVQPGQTLVLKNRESGEQQECRVVHMEKGLANTNEVGILFAQPAPHFWGVDFPPVDWKPFLEQRKEH
jgi:hypothetical protein